MSLRLGHPLALLLLLGVGLLAAGLARRYAAPTSSVRGRLWLLAPGLALVLLALSIAAPQVRTGSHRATTFVVDRSASIDANMAAVELRWGATAGSDDCVAPCRSVNFASSPNALGGESGSAPGSGATDLESALSTAVGLTPSGGRVVMLSDGGQTAGDALAATALAVRRHVQVDWVPLTDARRRDAAITSIHVPTAVRVGDEVPLALTVHSTVAGTARLSIQRDGGTPASESIHLRVGDNPLLLSYTATQPGFSSFAATIALPGDAVGANNSLTAVVDVRPAPRVLVVTSRGDSPVPPLLSAQSVSVSTTGPSGLPQQASAYGTYAAVVLDDVSATQLGASQVTALDAAVRTGGLGLLALGGPHSFSEGRYWGSRLQQILPVTSLKPGNLQRKNLAIELVLDHSGSMIDLAGGVPKIEMAREGAHQVAGFIAGHRDQLGIVDFDTAAHTLLGLQSLVPGASEQRANAAIDTLAASGGTNIYGGLQAGFQQLLKSHAPKRHLILMTDGISAGADYGPLLSLIRRQNISVATIALGTDADRPLLAQIAKETGGHAYITDNASDVPKILVKETQESAKPVRVTGHLRVSVTGDSPIVRSLAGTQLPELSGNVVVKLKSGAQADLSATGQDSQTNPALAEWQVGAGRVVAWTPGLGAPWALAWLKQPTLWDDAVRWSERGITATQTDPTAVSSGALQIDLASRGRSGLGVTSIAGTLTGADGVAHPVSFSLVGPALYTVEVTSLAPGVYRYALRGTGSGGYRSSGEVALPSPAEYSPVSVRTSPLGELVAQTGGRILSAGDPGALSASVYGFQRLLALLALLAFLAGVLVRLGVRVRRPMRVG